jgi:hypothetical protein
MIDDDFYTNTIIPTKEENVECQFSGIQVFDREALNHSHLKYHVNEGLFDGMANNGDRSDL